MEIKVIRKDFLNELDKFMSKGPLTYKGKDDYQIKSAVVYSTETSITFVGWNKSCIWSRFTLPATVTNIKTNLVLGDLEAIIGKAKKCKSNELVIVIEDTMLYVKDSKQHFDLPFETISLEGFAKATDWYRFTKLENGEVVLRPNEETIVKYTPWFTLEESKELSDSADNCLKDGMSAEINMATEDNKLVIESPNDSKQIGYGTTIDVTEKIKAAFLLKGSIPILNNVSKQLDVHYYILTSQAGKTRFWFHNGNTDWMLEVTDDAPKTD